MKRFQTARRSVKVPCKVVWHHRVKEQEVPVRRIQNSADEGIKNKSEQAKARVLVFSISRFCST
jgi:hypothetical protein